MAQHLFTLILMPLKLFLQRIYKNTNTNTNAAVYVANFRFTFLANKDEEKEKEKVEEKVLAVVES